MLTEVTHVARPRRLSLLRPECRTADRPRTLTVDIGVSWIRALVLDERGVPVRPPHRQVFSRTPSPTEQQCVLDAVLSLTEHVEPFDRVSVGFPGTIYEGIVVQSTDMGSDWAGCPLASTLERRFARPVRAANATDLQGWGAICGKGVEMMMTLGVHVRASLFLDGVIVPNVQVGRHRLTARRFEEDGVQVWGRRLLKMAASLKKRYGYDHLYLGGPCARHVRAAVLPQEVTIVASLNTLLGGMALWQERETW
jgi:polyphosphate glucokinase